MRYSSNSVTIWNVVHSVAQAQRNFSRDPFADAMTHAGQLAMLRRLAGATDTA